MKSALLALAVLMSWPAFSAAEPSKTKVRVQGDVVVAPGEEIETAVAILGNVRVEGTVTGEAVSVFGDVLISTAGSVGGDAVSVGGRVVRNGRLDGREVAIESPGKDWGRGLLVALPVLAAAAALVGALVIVASTIGFIVLVVAILVLFDRNVAAARQTMVVDPFRTFLIGFLVFLASIPLTVFLAVTVVGIPLAILAGAALMAAICLGTVAVCDWIGAEISRRARRPLSSVWSGLLGLTVLFLIGLIPWLGTVAHAVALLLGLGAVTQTRFRPVPAPPAE